MDRITIPRFSDFHFHFRDGELLRLIIQLMVEHWAYVVAMPNLVLGSDGHPVYKAELIAWYRREILRAAEESGRTVNPDFRPLMVLYVTERTTPDMVSEAYAAGAVAIKIYPRGVTTNSHWGIERFEAIYPALMRGTKHGMLILSHSERAGAREGYEEQEFIPILESMLRSIPGLKLVVEHVSSGMMARWVQKRDANVFATITPHHLLLTKKDTRGNPHHQCRPMPKTESDRVALVEAATNPGEKFFYGSDAAAHSEDLKMQGLLTGKPKYGVFGEPAGPPAVVTLFEQQSALDNLSAFMSLNGPRAYGLPMPAGKITFAKKPWVVPEKFGCVVPFLCGQTLDWQIEQ